MKNCYVVFAVAVVLLGTANLQAAPIFVGGPSPVPTFGGTVIDFEGVATGTLINTQYAAQGVSFFIQDDGGDPMIDNKSFLFAYESSSGNGVLTGSTDGGAAFPTVAGLIASFAMPVARAGAFFSDTSPLGNYTITAFDTGGGVLESFVVLASSLPHLGDAGVDGSAPWDGTGGGVFVGFEFASNVIGSIQFGPSAASGDAFAIDDLRFEKAGVPEPSTVILWSLGGIALIGFGRRRRKRVA